jgi:hypothetical protein
MDVPVDVIEVEIAPPYRIRIMARSETKNNAETIIKMAVIRRGVKQHFFTTAPSNFYQDGDTRASKM